MKIHRFFNLQAGDNQLTMQGNEAKQVLSVLRLKVGDRVVFFDGKNLTDYIYEITLIEGKQATFSLIDSQENTHEYKKNVHLYLSILKRDNFELALEKAVELGVVAITPIITARTIKKNIKLERLQKIAKEATEQSGRGVVPKIFEPLKFLQALKDAKNPILFDPTGTKIVSESDQEVSIFIGPEGGWHNDELSLALKEKMQILSLGKTILRAETAAIVGVARMLNL